MQILVAKVNKAPQYVARELARMFAPICLLSTATTDKLLPRLQKQDHNLFTAI
jgi:hypothetical protein